MSEDTWRPLGVETEDEIAEYDALHDGVPAWMRGQFWTWVQDSVTVRRRYRDGSGSVRMLDTGLAEAMCQTLGIALADHRSADVDATTGVRQLRGALQAFETHKAPLQLADYLLAHDGHASPEDLEGVLARSRSVWTVGTRLGHQGLVRRVAEGVQVAADDVMARAGRAGLDLAKAWGELYGLDPNPSEAYRLAIRAVEEAAVPVACPGNKRATLGTVLSDMETQDGWKLPMDREHPKAASIEVLLGMMRLLWHGQHDRHGGQPSAPGSVSIGEAKIAVGIAVTLVHLFSDGLVQREA